MDFVLTILTAVGAEGVALHFVLHDLHLSSCFFYAWDNRVFAASPAAQASLHLVYTASA